MEPILGVSLSRDVRVGSNLPGGASGAGWLYALPRLEHGRVVCLGSPSAATLTGLARSARTLVVVPVPRSRILRGLSAGRRAAPATTVASADSVVTERIDPWSWGELDGLIDLLVVSPWGRRAWPGAAEHLARHLARDGLLYAEGNTHPVRPEEPVLRLRLTPGLGEVRAVVPEADAPLLEELRRRGLRGTVSRRPKLTRWERRYVPERVQGATRRAVVQGLPAGAELSPPAYVVDAARQAGLTLSDWRWAVAARGDHDSQKVLVLLAPPGEQPPRGMVKVTRAAHHSARLLNEARALERLAGLRIADGRAPVPWFSTVSAGRALLGQSLVPGVPFGAAATTAASDPLVADALAWLNRLAEATARPVASANVSQVLGRLVARWGQVYTATPREVLALREGLAPLEQLGGELPLVLQHGDPGHWNVLAGPDARAAFLDWESAEEAGLPLWDLLYFARSWAIEISRREGVTNRVEGAAHHLLGSTAFGEVVAATVDDQVARLGIPPEAVRPLVLGCWLHRSLKEANRLTERQLGRSESAALLRRILEVPPRGERGALAGRGRGVGARR